MTINKIEEEEEVIEWMILFLHLNLYGFISLKN